MRGQLDRSEAGTVSHGTQRTQDLILAFTSFLQVTEDDLADNDLSEGLLNSRNDDDPYWMSEEAGWDLEILLQMMLEIAPEGYFFGPHPGDASDYGFWEDGEDVAL